jgi:hypothetical protein
MAGLELIVGAFPQVLALGRLQFNPAALPERATWSYELRNVLDESVGTADCALSASGEDFALECLVHQAAFEATLGSSYFKTGAYELQQTVIWRGRDLHLLEAQGEQVGDPASLAWRIADGALTTSDSQTVHEPVSLPSTALLEHEWPWRLQTLPFSLGYSQKAPLAWPLRWSEAAQASVPQVEETLVVVRGAEPLWTPYGNFIAWVVTVGDDQTAWYDSETPHTLLKYDNGMVTYLLTGVE